MNPVVEAAARNANAPSPDPIGLAVDLSHQLEEARSEIDRLLIANRELGSLRMRAEAARDILKELLVETLARHERILK